MNKENLLELQQVSTSYGGLQVLHGVNVAIDEGEIVALIGPNGAGKSTILKVLFGLISNTGKILWHGDAITPLPHEMVLRGVSLVPQGRRVFSHLSVYENLAIGGAELHSKQLLQERIVSLEELFPVLHRKRSLLAGALSGGEQQMLAIARGLMTSPQLLLLDEPSLGLAPKVVHEVFQAIATINREHKTAILIVEHNLQSVLRIAHRAYLLDKGIVRDHGLAKDVLSGKEFEQVFFGVTV